MSTPVDPSAGADSSSPHQQPSGGALNSALPASAPTQAAQQASQQARKKKITRLIPAEESLAVIEECTEHSEDSSIVSASDGNITPKHQLSKIGKLMKGTKLPEVLGETPLSDASLASLEQKEAEEEELLAASKLTNRESYLSLPKRANSTQKQGNGDSAIAVAIAPRRSGDESSSNEDTVATEKMTDAEDEEDQNDGSSQEPRKALSAPPHQQQGHRHQTYNPQFQHRLNPQHPSTNGDASPSEQHPSHLALPASAPLIPQHPLQLSRSPPSSPHRSPTRSPARMTYTTPAFPSDPPSNSMPLIDDLDGDDTVDGGSSTAQTPVNDDGMFDFDDDFADELDEPEKEEILTWRLDPAQSLSDWTIVVKSRESETSNSYHVHKNILAVGPRKSEYFVNVFRMIGRAGDQSSSTTTEVVLGEVAAKVFPQLLDFMYSVDGELDVSTARACGLRHLAQFFGVRALHKRVMDFIQKDLSMTTIVTYYIDVCSLRDEKLLLNIAKFCSKNIMKVDTAFPLVEVMDPFFFSKILTSQYINSKEKRYHTSLLVAEYCRINKKRMDSKRFMMLTDEVSLPVVHYSAALALMEMEADIVVTTSLESLMEMTSLQNRCIKDLSTHWRDLMDMDMQAVTRVCRKLPSSVVTELLVKSLASAKRKVAEGDNMETSSKHSTGTTSSRYSKKHDRNEKEPLESSRQQEKRISSKKESSRGERDSKKDNEIKLEQLKQAHVEEIVRLKTEYETNLVRMRDMLVDKDKTISRFWNEIKGFERLPNNHDGKLVASGRQHEASYVPDVRSTAAEGYLFVSKKGGPKYPLFYYKKEDRDKSESASTQTR